MIKINTEKYILRLATGDVNALKALYDCFHREVYCLSLIILKDKELAEDSSQEVFLKLLTKANTFRKGENPKAWILGITRNVAIDTLRKRKNLIYTDFMSKYGQESNTLIDDTNIDEIICYKLDIEQALEYLDASSREIVLLHLLSGVKFREISEILDIPMGTVTWRYQAAIKNLKKILNGGNMNYEYMVRKEN